MYRYHLKLVINTVKVIYCTSMCIYTVVVAFSCHTILLEYQLVEIYEASLCYHCKLVVSIAKVNLFVNNRMVTVLPVF